MMIIQHPDYIRQSVPQGLDHVRSLKSVFKFVNPPKYEQDTPEWGEAVKESAGEKINELIERYKWVGERYYHNIALIHRHFDYLPKEDFTLEFWLTLETYPAVEERKVIKKWLKYWKRVYESVSVEELIPKEEFEDKRFTDDQLDRAREVPIEGMYEGTLRTNYGKQIGLCPFHEEHTPSFTIFTNENKFHCFGCQKHGDAIDFYMATRGVDFVEAVKGLLNEN